MSKVLEEAYEMVEHGAIGADDFRRFAFANTARLWAGMNPEFFKGTAVERDVARLLVEPVE
jgi:hypothetical protein